MPNRATRLLQKLVEPSPRLTDADLRRRATIHSSLVLVVLVVGLGAVAAEEIQHPPFSTIDAGHIVIWIGMLVLTGAYALSRTRHYVVSATLTVFAMSTLIWRLWAVDAANDPTRPTPYFVALPLIMAALLLPLWVAFVFVGMTIASVALIPTFSGLLGAPVPRNMVYDLAVFVVGVSALSMAGAELLERSRRQLAEKTVALETANDKLKQMESSRIQFLNQAAHDLASPLTPVRIQAEVLRRVGDAHPDLPIGPSVGTINRNLDLFQHLLQDIRDLAKLDAGQLKLEPKRFRVQVLVDEVLATYEPVAAAKPITLAKDAVTDAEVVGDQRRLVQVLHNLTSNAIKFTPPQGSVTVSAQTHGAELEVRVKDTGRGLEKTEIDKLFRPFSQVHDRSEVKERGTGLGLFICKGFIEAHGGRIWVTSEGRGTGSVFVFRVPLEGPRALAG